MTDHEAAAQAWLEEITGGPVTIVHHEGGTLISGWGAAPPPDEWQGEWPGNDEYNNDPMFLRHYLLTGSSSSPFVFIKRWREPERDWGAGFVFACALFIVAWTILGWLFFHTLLGVV